MQTAKKLDKIFDIHDATRWNYNAVKKQVLDKMVKQDPALLQLGESATLLSKPTDTQPVKDTNND